MPQGGFDHPRERIEDGHDQEERRQMADMTRSELLALMTAEAEASSYRADLAMAVEAAVEAAERAGYVLVRASPAPPPEEKKP